MKIKIRAWSNQVGRMMIGWEPYDQPKREYVAFSFDIGFSYYDEDDFVMMLGTGLKDKHGVDVYEGDIVKLNECQDLHVIYWDDESAGFCKRPIDSDFETEIRGMENWEVVGNVYEPPELVIKNVKTSEEGVQGEIKWREIE